MNEQINEWMDHLINQSLDQSINQSIYWHIKLAYAPLHRYCKAKLLVPIYMKRTLSIYRRIHKNFPFVWFIAHFFEVKGTIWDTISAIGSMFAVPKDFPISGRRVQWKRKNALWSSWAWDALAHSPIVCMNTANSIMITKPFMEMRRKKKQEEENLEDN